MDQLLLDYVQSCEIETPLNTFPRGFLAFLQSTRIVTLDSPVIRPSIHRIYPDTAYYDVVKELVEMVVMDPQVAISMNTLGQAQYGEAWRGRQFSCAANTLLEPNWGRVCRVIGVRQFVNMVLNCRGLVKLDHHTWFQVFGPSALDTQRAPPAATSVSLLNKNYTSWLPPRPTIDNELIQKAWTRLFRMTGTRMSHIRLRFLPRPERVAEVLILGSGQHDEFGEGSTPNPTENQVFRHRLDRKKVLQTISAMVAVVVPKQAFGNGHTKRKLMQLISRFVQNTAFKITKDQLVFSGYAELWYWVFCELIPYLVKCQFRAADVKGTMSYFYHGAWARLTSTFLGRYKKEFLEEFDLASFAPKHSYQYYNYGRIRLIPKALEFRLICIPLKRKWGQPQNQISYLAYRANLLKPIQHILRQRIIERFHHLIPPCFGTTHLANMLANWKSTIKIPPEGIHYFRVDFSKCYDRLDHDFLLETLREMFAEDSDDHNYVYANQQQQKLLLTKWAPPVAQVMGTLQLFVKTRAETVTKSKSKADLVVVHKGKFVQITKKTLIDFCEDAVRNAFLLEGWMPWMALTGAVRERRPGTNNEIVNEKPSRGWRRTTGVFQGFPLLATFCDLVLNRMVVSEFASWLTSPELLIVRVVDDLLFLSPKRDIVGLIQQHMMSSQLHKYGIKLNRDKTDLLVWSSETAINFLGVDIDIHGLSISNVNRPSLGNESFETFYKQLLYQYNRGILGASARLDWIFRELNSSFSSLASHDIFQRDTFFAFLGDVISGTPELDEMDMVNLIEGHLQVGPIQRALWEQR